MRDGDGYRGFIPDLLDSISQEEKDLAFDIQLVRDKQYGTYHYDVTQKNCDVIWPFHM